MASSDDLSTIASLTVQINALSQQKAAMPDGPGRQLLDAQIAMLSAQLSAVAQHAQSQADASSNLLKNLGLFSTLTGLVGNSAPTIINLFKR